MAKKLNKKVAVIGIILLVLVVGGGMTYLVGPKVARRLGFFQNPEKALAKSHAALEAGDYKEAELQLALSYSYGKTDEYKIERLFELAEFHMVNNAEHEADWPKALGSWSKIVSIDAENLDAQRKLLDYFYQIADAGDGRAWKNVNEKVTEILEVLDGQGIAPDTFLLMAQAKSLLAISQRGGTTDRREPLAKCVVVLEKLIEAEPKNGEAYTLMANAMVIEGELDASSGIIEAKEKAQAKGLGFLETAVEQADDKATAVADLMLYKMQTAQNDPNTLEAIRAEIEDWSQRVQPNDKLWLITSIAYETAGKMSAEAELNRAIEAIRQAHTLKPDDFEYVIRLSKLMYRKGNAFNDEAAAEDALQIAENALSLDEVQDIPGPMQSRNLNYRFMLNAYLADLYLGKALVAREAGQDAERESYTKKAEDRIAEIISTLGSTDNPMAQKFHGLVALAKGQQDQAARLLYKSYEASKALDKPSERGERVVSNVDAKVCLALASIAKQQGQLGLQNEFLRGAFSSRDNYVLNNPQLLLDYAQSLRQFGAWGAVKQIVQNYQGRYGVNEQSRMLEIEASVAMNEFEKAAELLASYEGTPDKILQYELSILINRVVQLKQTLNSLKAEKKEPTPEQTQELKTLRQERNELLEKAMKASPDALSPSLVATISIDLIQNGQPQLAVQYLDTYLAVTPDVLNLMVIRLQAQQEDPLALTQEQLSAIREQAINAISDEKEKAVRLSEFYRYKGDSDKAIEVLEKSPQVDIDDPEIVQLRFDMALQQEDLQTAETLQQKIRTENLDRCEGNLAAARLEMVKGNHQLALRRLDECLSLSPLLSISHFYKSQAQQELDDQEGAIDSAKSAIGMDPQNASYARQLASLLFTRYTMLGNKITVEQQTETEQAIGAAIRLNPSDTQLKSVYAEIIQSRDPDRALLIRQNLMTNSPSASNALLLGGMALRMASSEWDDIKKTGLIELAGKAYEQGMKAEPENETLLQAYADYQQKAGKEGAIEILGDNKNLKWKFYLRNGQFDKAEATLKELIQETPDDPLLVKGMVLVSQGAGNRDQVRDSLSKLLELDEAKETELWVLQKYIDNGFVAEAEKNLARLKERHPDEKAILLVEAWILMGKGQLDESLILANRYLETDTNNPGGWRLRGRLYRLMGQPRKAIDDLQRSKGLQDSPAVRMELATVYTELNQITAAIGELVSSLDDPQSPVRMRLTLEDLYKKSRRGSDLEKFYKSSQEKYPDNPFWYYRAGVYFLTAQKQYAKAEKLLEKAWGLCVEQKRLDPQVFDFYLDSLFQAKKYDQAMTLASSQIDTPLATISYAYMGQIQFALGQREKASESFVKALDKAGSIEAVLQGTMAVMLKTVGEDVVTAWISAGMAKGGQEALPAYMMASSLSQSKGSYNEAIEQIDRCIEIVGEDSRGWLSFALKKVNLLIMVYTKTGDQGYMTRATELLTAMLKLQPNNASLLNNMAYLLTDNDQQLDTALGYARRAHQAEPANATYLDTYAYAQCKNGQFEKAETNLIRATQIYEASGQPLPWDMYKHFGMAKEGLNKTSEAIEMYQKALDASDQILEKEKQQLQEAIERLQQSQ